MSAPSSLAPTGPVSLPEPANERFKRNARAGTWVGMLLATGAHLLVFLLWPSMTVEISAETRTASEVLALPPVDPPAEPAPLTTPARPVPVADVAPEITIAPTVPEAYRPPLQPPPADAPTRQDRGLIFTPMTTRPRMLNPEEVARRLEAAYPTTLRDAGIGGEVVLHVHIDEEGRLLETRLGVSSGFESLDRAALRVSEVFRFSPALNRERPVAVWIALPVLFQSR